jgi:hypothetical protein
MVEVHNAQATIYITSKKILFVLFQIKFQLAIMSYLREKKRIKDQVRYFYNALLIQKITNTHLKFLITMMMMF